MGRIEDEGPFISFEPGEFFSIPRGTGELRAYFAEDPDGELAEDKAAGTEFDDWLADNVARGLLVPTSEALPPHMGAPVDEDDLWDAFSWRPGVVIGEPDSDAGIWAWINEDGNVEVLDAARTPHRSGVFETIGDAMKMIDAGAGSPHSARPQRGPRP